MKALNILSIDVEEWYHILDVASAPQREEWEGLPSRVEPAFLRMLDVVEERGARCTCFFLGWVAQRYPRLVREAVERGHEAASHGLAHELVYTQTRQQFFTDITEAKKILEDLAGEKVEGYRAPGFSVTEQTPWFFETLAEAGYRYDSSVFPAVRGHGGMRGAPAIPYSVTTPAGEVREYPISTATWWGKRYCFSGGGYFRLFPYRWIAYESRRLNRKGLPVIVYLHPREADPEHPRLPMKWTRRFKSYVNLQGSMKKLSRLLGEFAFTSFAGYRQKEAERERSE